LDTFQRGGTPSPADRLLCHAAWAVRCADLINQNVFGVMVAARGDGTEPVPLEKVAGQTPRQSARPFLGLKPPAAWEPAWAIKVFEQHQPSPEGRTIVAGQNFYLSHHPQWCHVASNWPTCASFRAIDGLVFPHRAHAAPAGQRRIVRRNRGSS